jgi:hypothetical protein
MAGFGVPKWVAGLKVSCSEELSTSISIRLLDGCAGRWQTIVLGVRRNEILSIISLRRPTTR